MLSRNTLLVNLRFLDAALSRLELLPADGISLASDGQHVVYDPRHILKRYKAAKEIPVRDYLHVLLHCVFRHMYVHTLVDHVCWDLACDVAVEGVIAELGLKSAEAPRAKHQQTALAKLKTEVGSLTAEKLYRHFLDGGQSPAELSDLRGLFYADDHTIWYLPPDQRAAALGQSSGAGDGESKVTAAEADWKHVSEQLQMDLETFSKQQGDRAGGLLQNLGEVNRERYDYTAFLKKFAVMGEVMRVNDEEFDYVYYTYGLRRYGNLPLIEPLEYKETKRIREFVIAIDTSGSVAGETVQRFVQKTWNILKTTESFFTKINLHIIQCDATIQEDAKITSQEEFDAYMKTMQIHGLGGTDFRPVFSYVDWLREKKEFSNLKGLIYFTDGFGAFPEQMPDYETAFVFLDEELNNYNVPPWAIKLVLRNEEI